MMLRSIVAALVLALAGCADITSGGTSDVPLTDPQNCAVGYDLSRAVGENVELRRTVLVAPGRPNRCEEYALAYLQRAGFAVDRTGRAPSFTVTLDRIAEFQFMATATIGDTLQIARMYQPQGPGVVALSPITVIHLGDEAVWRSLPGQFD